MGPLCAASVRARGAEKPSGARPKQRRAGERGGAPREAMQGASGGRGGERRVATGKRRAFKTRRRVRRRRVSVTARRWLSCAHRPRLPARSASLPGSARSRSRERPQTACRGGRRARRVEVSGRALGRHLLCSARRKAAGGRRGKRPSRGIRVRGTPQLLAMSRGLLTRKASQQFKRHEVQKNLPHGHRWTGGKRVHIFQVNTAKKLSAHPGGRPSESGLLHAPPSIWYKKHFSMIHGNFSLRPYFSIRPQVKWQFLCSGSSSGSTPLPK